MPGPYLPFLNGEYSTAPGLQLLRKGLTHEDRQVFQIDNFYHHYLANKKACLEENSFKYYCEENVPLSTIKEINSFIVHQLLQEHPNQFDLFKEKKKLILLNKITGEKLIWSDDWLQIDNNLYRTLFDGLCNQVQEDVAVCQVDDQGDYLAALHLSAPNHWAAEAKIGKPFNTIHGEIPGMEKTLTHNHKMLHALVHKGPFTRFAWGLATDNRLNHHPEVPPGLNPEIWIGRKIENDDTPLYVRVERQNTVGFPRVKAFLFTIRTYFYEVSNLQASEKLALLKGVESMSDASLQYKGLKGCLPLLNKILRK